MTPNTNCESAWWRYRCSLERGHPGLHRHLGGRTRAEWNDAEARLGFPRRTHDRS